MDLNGKHALITGGAGALGTVIARTLAGYGANITVIDLNRDGAEALADSLRDTGVRAQAVGVDLTDFDAVQDAIGRAIDAFGGADILVNGAGGGAVSYFHEMTLDTWRTQMSRNLDSVFVVTRAVLPAMIESGSGRIINIASIAAVSGGRLVRGATAYAAAKAGVVGLTKALAIEVAEQGITVNAIAPGAQGTNARDGDTPERREALLSQIPTRLLGQPEHLAETIAFLSSDAAVNITGVILPLDGGHSI
ncbi:MAG: SDR family oxidoreductase [Mycetocola sp.]